MMGLVTPILFANVTFRFQRFTCSYLLPVWVARSGTEAFEPFCASVVWECLILINSTAFGKGVVDLGFASFETRCRSTIRVVDDWIRFQILLRSFVDSLGRRIRCFSTCGSSVLTIALSFLTRNTICTLQSAYIEYFRSTLQWLKGDSQSTKGTLLVLSHGFAMSEKLICHRTAYYFMSNSRFSMFNLGWVSLRQLLRTLSLMVQPRHWVVWLRRLDVGGYASLVRWIA